LSRSVELPAFILKKSIRELIEAGYLEEKDGKYQVSETGKQKI